MTSPGIPSWKSDFLSSCLSSSALRFGTFTLKSGRSSPYFFNAGVFHTAAPLHALSLAFAHTIAAHSTPAPLEFDVLFGPAYKGIPLAVTTIGQLAALDERRFGDVAYSFNRKEVKAHGDKGTLVGAALQGKRVLIVDDVMTAGTAVREAVDIITKEGGTLVGIVVALDRMEKMPTPQDDDGVPGPSAVGEVRRQYGVPVLAILTLDDIIAGFQQIGTQEDLERMEAYRQKYRASN